MKLNKKPYKLAKVTRTKIVRKKQGKIKSLENCCIILEGKG